MLKKSLVIATLAAEVASASFAGKAQEADPILGALIGGGIGAAIGHDVNRHNGGAVGGVVGAIIGSSIAADSNRYYGYDDRYYGDRYYAPPAYGYYAPPPVYYAPPAYSVVYSSGPSYRYRSGYRDHRWHDGYRYR